MQKPYNCMLTTSVKVLEEWAMMLVDPSDESFSIFDVDSTFLKTSITFKGELEGRVIIVVQPDFMENLASNMLDAIDATNRYFQEDALKELCNVVTGNYITEAFGEHQVFNVLSPEISTISADSAQRLLSTPAVCWLRADDTPIAVTFEISEHQ